MGVQLFQILSLIQIKFSFRFTQYARLSSQLGNFGTACKIMYLKCLLTSQAFLLILRLFQKFQPAGNIDLDALTAFYVPYTQYAPSNGAKTSFKGRITSSSCEIWNRKLRKGAETFFNNINDGNWFEIKTSRMCAEMD